ncbi:DNA-directed RNA polymerase sigma-70 factor [Acidithiobacillus thiooxidans ATCC 19377]|jgi:RNA polymerase sigma-70 factor (ECF subfamily)|uniref:DNA-directed RNA polymerase sigma-70 factor n=2 Tax=Acidithiobacillaceae TaxID=225058 RepID=A0A5P9XRH5_ACITH|nr:DNA-directed RNA polymerase sigma-70 factor [Acidithiobacillus thiooxidans ATCC 19377]
MIAAMNHALKPLETCVTHAWKMHQAEIFGFLRHRLGDDDLSADLLQLVFLKALHEGRRFCELREPRAWLFTVARHVLTDNFRSQRDYVDLPEELAEPVAEVPAVDSLADCLPHVFTLLETADRDILTCCELQGMTQKAYALSHGLSLAAAKSRLLRARLRLRAALMTVCEVRFDADSGQVCCHLPHKKPS